MRLKSEFLKLRKTDSGQSQNAQRGQGDFDEETAKSTGKSKSTVRRDKARSEAIPENLMRAELSPAEMAEHLKRRKRLWEERKNTGPTCPTKAGKGQPEGFAKDTENKTGTPKRTTYRKALSWL